MSKKKSFILAIVILAVVAICVAAVLVFIQGMSPPINRPESVALRDWIHQWEERLPVEATLKKSSQYQTMGMSSVTYRVYSANVKIFNRTGYKLSTGHTLYMVETADPSLVAAGSEILTVAGGYFTEVPLEDYSGVVEFRGPEEEGTEQKSMGLLNEHSRLSGGSVYRRLGPIIQVTTSESAKDEEVEQDFGAADGGGVLELETELMLAVMVDSEALDRVHLVSPPLVLTDPTGTSTEFRYILGFVPGKESEDKEDGEVWELTERTLLPMNEEGLLPHIKTPGEALWLRTFTAHWAAACCRDAVLPVLEEILSAKGEEGDDAIRTAAISSLGYGRSSSALPLIIKVAQDKSEPDQLRRAALIALGEIGDKEATPALLDFIRAEDEDMARLAIQALGKLGDKTAIEPLLNVLEEDYRNALCSAAGESLKELVDDSHLPRLAEIASNREANTQGVYEAVNVIGNIGSINSVTKLSNLYQMGPSFLRVFVCDSLGVTGRTEALPVLKSALQDSDDAVRKAAIEAISEFKSEEGCAVLREALSHPDLEIKEKAIRELAERNDGEAKARIVAVAMDVSTEIDLRKSAAAALALYGDKESLDVLLSLLSDSDPEMRVAVVTAFGDIDKEEAQKAIIGALQDKNAEVRIAATNSLRQMDGEEAAQAIADAFIKEKNSSAMEDMAYALKNMEYKDLSTLPQFLEKLRDADSYVRNSIVWLLNSISGQDFELEYDASPQDVEAFIEKYLKWWREETKQ